MSGLRVPVNPTLQRWSMQKMRCLIVLSDISQRVNVEVFPSGELLGKSMAGFLTCLTFDKKNEW